MRLGINTFLFTSPFTNESTALFPTFKKWGFQTVEIPVEDPSHITPSHVKRELDKNKLVCGSVCACMGPDRDLRGSPEQQKTGLDYMLKLIDQAVELNCPSLIGPVYSAVGRADAVPPEEYKQQWKAVVNNLRTLCDYAESRGRQVCLEPLNRFETDFINTCDQALQMIKDVGSPALKLHLDTFHMNIEEKNQAKAIRKAGKLLGHFKMAKQFACFANGFGLVLLLDIHVEGIEMELEGGTPHVLDHLQRLVAGIDEVSLESIERFQTNLAPSALRVITESAQVIHDRLPLLLV